MTPDSLITAWRDRARELEPYAPAAARAFLAAAGELEAALRDASETLLTLTEASAESGYSTDHLRRELRQGRIPNAGRRNAPRIRRRDLPRKAGHVLTIGRPPAPSPAQIARSVVHSP